MIVQYYADSLGLARPGFVSLQQRYIYLFEEWLRKNCRDEIFLINRARRGFTIDKLYEVYKEDEEYIDGKKDILIIHEGVCDCAPRPVSASTRKIISGLPGFLKKRAIHYLHKNRAKLLKRGSVHFLVSQAQYEKILAEWLADAIKKFNTIYLFNIAPTNDRIESHSPGFGKSINDYNAIMQRVVAEMNNNKIKLIDVYTVIKNAENINDLIIEEDGHHITARSHKLYADLLIKMAEQEVR